MSAASPATMHVCGGLVPDYYRMVGSYVVHERAPDGKQQKEAYLRKSMIRRVDDRQSPHCAIYVKKIRKFGTKKISFGTDWIDMYALHSIALHVTDVRSFIHSFHRVFGGFVTFWSSALCVFFRLRFDDSTLQDISIVILFFSGIESFLLQDSYREEAFDSSELQDKSLRTCEKIAMTTEEESGIVDSSHCWILKVVMAVIISCLMTFLFSLVLCATLRIGSSSPLIG
uniref:Uncharacterized protein n=1 Tax=Odontella aurita TaxID=265563 RepID=A0A7S4J5F7_9STRA